MQKILPFFFIFSFLIYLSAGQFQGEALRFKLSAVNLPNCDLGSPSDPYVKLYSTTVVGHARHHHHDWQKFGQSSVKKDTLNPVWDEEFVYQYFNGTHQRWRFVVMDLDDSWWPPNPFDDPLGSVALNVDDYAFQIRHAQSKQNQTGGTPLNQIQMFLSHPIGGALRITPVLD